MQNSGRRLNDWRPPWQRKGLTERVLNALLLLTRVKWKTFAIVLLIVLLTALLSACASPPKQCLPSNPPKELMVPPPPPGSMSDRLEAILKRGQTSEQNSTP